MPADYKASEAVRFLAKHPDIQGVDLLIPDLCGILRGKRLTRDSLSKLYSEGIRMPGGVFALEATGDSVIESGLIWDEGEQDRICRPVQSTLVPMPWSQRPLGQVIATMTDHDGAPFYGDSRAILAGVLDCFAADGLAPCIAIELEFYLIDRAPDGEGRPQPPVSPVTGKRDRKTQVLTLTDIGDYEALFAAIDNGAAIQGLPVEGTIKEAAPAQYEVNLRYCEDALRGADHGLMLKRLVKGVAERHGFAATFMAKPYPDHAGCGLHIHVSLLDRDGRNIFDDGGDRGSPALRHAVAGLLATMRDAQAIFAPNANSYRRFREGSYAPTRPLWGYNNRTTAVRIPAGEGKARRIEHRVAGADANVHLATAAVLAGIHHGLTHRLDPGAPVEGNGYAAEAEPLPRSWADALRLFEASPFIAEYFGQRFQRLYSAVRNAERRRFEAVVTPTELDWYLRAV
ncbi:MAG TPA: glutamine synthetase family protein [Alphaproteobacteria bacterium]|nr:glutamine synthetase family protein [Alphaproteobacteria bacterium]